MPAPTDCLAALVGVTANGSNCFPLPAPGEGQDNDAYTVSGSGLYIDQLPQLSFKVAQGNPAPELWERVRKCRDEAATELRAQLLSAARAGYGLPRYTAQGYIGRAGAGAPYPLGTAASLTFNTNEASAAYRITSIKLLATQTVASVPLTLDGAPVATLNSTNGVPQAVSIRIPLDGQQHTLVAELPDGVRPLESAFFCEGCNSGSPWALSLRQNVTGWTSNTTPAYGFVLTMKEECGDEAAQGDALCYATGLVAEGGEPRFEQLRLYVAQAVRYKAAEIFVVSLMTDASVSRYTMLEPKALPALASYFKDKVAEHVSWLTGPDGLRSASNPCFVCQAPAWQPKKVDMLARYRQ